jgi:hypothetical protein
MAQFSALIHAVEHPYHAPSQSCQSFSAMEHTGNAVLSCAIQLSLRPAHANVSVTLSTPLLVCPQSPYISRARPVHS